MPPNCMWVRITCSRGERSPSNGRRVVGAVPEHESGWNCPQARWWSGQFPSTMVVWTVPEHKDSHDSPQARGWSGQSPSTKSVAKNHVTCTIILCIYLFTCSIKSNLTRLVKKVDGYSTSYCRFVLSSKQLRGTCQ